MHAVIRKLLDGLKLPFRKGPAMSYLDVAPGYRELSFKLTGTVKLAENEQEFAAELALEKITERIADFMVDGCAQPWVKREDPDLSFLGLVKLNVWPTEFKFSQLKIETNRDIIRGSIQLDWAINIEVIRA